MARSYNKVLIVSLCVIFPCAVSAYKDDIGYTKLVNQQGINVNNGSGIVITQVEADTDGVAGAPFLYLPDTTNAEFDGKIIHNISNVGSIPSAHATSVGVVLYGMRSMANGIIDVNVYEVNNWLQSGYLNFGYSQKPLYSSSRIGNHSWVGATGNALYDSEILRRLDWVIETDDTLQIVGTRNSIGLNANLLSGSYNVLAVGKTNGLHSTGSSNIDSIYVSGRSKTEIVVPQSVTSIATPIVAATAAVLVEHAHANPGLSSGVKSDRYGHVIYHAESTEVIKAALMAGADRYTKNISVTDNISDYRTAPVNQSGNGLDKRFGAGQLNIYNSYQIIAAGEQSSYEDDRAGNGIITSSGFDYDAAFGGASGSNDVASYYVNMDARPRLIKVSLAWNININGGSRNFDGSAILYDLDLALYDVTDGPVLVQKSSSSIDNTENIWLPLEQNRSYMIRIETKPGQSAFLWDYALAWQIENDADSDQIVDDFDNCPDFDNRDQSDIDGDGIGDVCEDDDGDGLVYFYETLYGTDPFSSDSDEDGLTDYQELFIYSTNPLVNDSDNDHVSDYDEVLFVGTDPNNSNMGDLSPYGNRDNQINVTDMMMLIRFIENLQQPDALDAIFADLNEDGIIDIRDVQIMSRMLGY